jgi:hypothetical protein
MMVLKSGVIAAPAKPSLTGLRPCNRTNKSTTEAQRARRKVFVENIKTFFHHRGTETRRKSFVIKNI